MATLSFEETKTAVLNERYALKMDQYTAYNDQLDVSLDEGQKIILKKKIAVLEAEILDIEKALTSQLSGQSTSQVNNRTLLDKLPYIDFKKIVRSFSDHIEQLGRNGGANVFVLQDSAAMAGDLLIHRLRTELQSEASHFQHVQIGFTGGIELSECGLLNGLASDFGLDVATAKQSATAELLTAVVEALCQSLQTRSVVFVEINQWHLLPEQDKVFHWLCNDFYSKLSTALSAAVSDRMFRRVYVFFVVISDDFISDACLASTQPFAAGDPGPIFALPLENWSETDIEIWLELMGLPEDELLKAASRLYKRGRSGIPSLVRNAIENDYCTA